uniref:Elongator complex protein 5 n=1 Tax=Spongospora subterranea TaxID=70186 RepID=A0A0H5R9X7_9EUKA|eukprot:CRZ10591.1 hypothetical protein [Spongospora subterranea]
MLTRLLNELRADGAPKHTLVLAVGHGSDVLEFIGHLLCRYPRLTSGYVLVRGHHPSRRINAMLEGCSHPSTVYDGHHDLISLTADLKQSRPVNCSHRPLIVFDSLSTHIVRHGSGPVCAMVADLLLSGFLIFATIVNANPHLESMSSACAQFHRDGTCSIVLRRQSGNCLYDRMRFGPGFERPEHDDEDGAHHVPIPDSTFNLDLSAEQRRAKDGLLLPYMRAMDGKAPTTRILHEDDDDSDPDNDLDI